MEKSKRKPAILLNIRPYSYPCGVQIAPQLPFQSTNALPSDGFVPIGQAVSA